MNADGTRLRHKLLGRKNSALDARLLMRLLTGFIRIITLCARFALVFGAAKYLSVQSFAAYGVFAVSVSYALYLVGLDFYTFTNREIARKQSLSIAAMLTSHGALCLFLYLAFLPAFVWGATKYGEISQSTVMCFSVILILEQLNQEIFRLLVVRSKAVWASLLFFVRNGAWVGPLICIWIYDPESRTLDSLLLGWICGGVIAGLMGVYTMRLAFKGQNIGRSEVNIAWIRKGVGVAIPLLIATLCYRAMYTLDRYFIDAYGTALDLAAYTLFASTATAALGMLDALVLSHAFPRLLHARNQMQKSTFMDEVKSFVRDAVGITIALGCGAYYCTLIVVEWVGRGEYLAHKQLLLLVIIGAVLNCLATVPQILLYVHNADEWITRSNLMGLVAFLAVICVGRSDAAYAAALGVVIANLIIFCAKTFFCIRQLARSDLWQAPRVTKVAG